MVAETVKKREGKTEEEKRLTERAKGRNVKGWKGKNKKRGRSFDIISGDKHRLKDTFRCILNRAIDQLSEH